MHLWVALVAVLHAAKIPPVGLGVLQKGDKVGHTHDVHRTLDAVAVKRGNRERHVSAVTAAGNADAARVEIRLRADPVKKRIDVFVRVLPLKAVVQQRECLAIAC